MPTVEGWLLPTTETPAAQDGPLEADHPADECVDDDEQGELPPVRPQAEADALGSAAHAWAAWRSLPVPCSTEPPV